MKILSKELNLIESPEEKRQSNKCHNIGEFIQKHITTEMHSENAHRLRCSRPNPKELTNKCKIALTVTRIHNHFPPTTRCARVCMCMCMYLHRMLSSHKLAGAYGTIYLV